MALAVSRQILADIKDIPRLTDRFHSTLSRLRRGAIAFNIVVRFSVGEWEVKPFFKKLKA
jgi:hypothetical protein